MCTQTSVRQSSTEWKKKLESKSEVKSVNNLLYPIDSYPEMLEANSDDRDVTANTGNGKNIRLVNIRIHSLNFQTFPTH